MVVVVVVVFFLPEYRYLSKQLNVLDTYAYGNLKPGVLYVKSKIIIDKSFHFTTLNSRLLVKKLNI